MSLRAVLALALIAVPSPALASSVALLPRTGGSGANTAAAQRVVDEARIVLFNEGWALHEVSEVSAALPAHLAACGPDDRCAHELRALLGVDVALGIRVWGDQDSVERIAVVFVGVRGVGSRAIVEVDPEVPLAFSVARAVRAAARTWSTGASEEMPGGPRALAPAEPRTEPSPVNYAIGTLLVLGSAPLLGYGINTAARDGDCVTEAAGGCVERVSFGDGAGISLGLGALVLIGGVVAFAAAPIRVGVSADHESARLVVGGDL